MNQNDIDKIAQVIYNSEVESHDKHLIALELQIALNFPFYDFLAKCGFKEVPSERWSGFKKL